MVEYSRHRSCPMYPYIFAFVVAVCAVGAVTLANYYKRRR